jgi:uncharacterized protein YegP (UPF0339 family)
MTKRPRIEIFRETNGQFGFRIRSQNGRTLVESSDYNTCQGARKGIAAIKVAITNPLVFDLRKKRRRTRKAKGGGIKSHDMTIEQRPSGQNALHATTESVSCAAQEHKVNDLDKGGDGATDV